jgi:hypothetical protein
MKIIVGAGEVKRNGWLSLQHSDLDIRDALQRAVWLWWREWWQFNGHLAFGAWSLRAVRIGKVAPITDENREHSLSTNDERGIYEAAKRMRSRPIRASVARAHSTW